MHGVHRSDIEGAAAPERPRRRRSRLGRVAAAIAGGSIAAASIGAAVTAGGPEHVRESYGYEGIFPPVTEACGFEVHLHEAGDYHQRDYGDGRIAVHDQGVFQLVNPANGKTLTQDYVRNYRGTHTSTILPGGIEEIRFTDVYSGLPERWRGPDGEILIFDAGLAIIDGVVLFDLGDPDDPFDDVLLSVSETFDLRGPHPILSGGGLGPDVACPFLAD